MSSSTDMCTGRRQLRPKWSRIVGAPRSDRIRERLRRVGRAIQEGKGWIQAQTWERVTQTSRAHMLDRKPTAPEASRGGLSSISTSSRAVHAGANQAAEPLFHIGLRTAIYQ